MPPSGVETLGDVAFGAVVRRLVVPVPDERFGQVLLLDDATRLATSAAAADVATLDVTPGVPHVFQAFAEVLDEGDAALIRVASFLRSHLSWED